MKVLIYRYGSICEPDIIRTLNKMGFTVLEYSREVTDKNVLPAESIKELSRFLQDNPVDFVFSINFFPYVAEVCNVFRLRYLSWIVDSPVMELYTSSIEKEYNRVFLFDRALYDEISPFNPGRVFHLPLAAEITEKEKLFKKASGSDRKRFSHEVAFVGSLYTEKCPYDRANIKSDSTRGYLDGIMRAQQKVYGYYFIEDLLTDEIVEDFRASLEDFYTQPGDTHLTDKRTLAQLYIGNKISAMERVDTFSMLAANFNTSIYTGSDTSKIKGIHNMGFAKSLTEMPLIFKNSKININITSKIIRTGLPLRIFDILSCEGFLISNFQEEIPELFVPGEDLVLYGSLEELRDLCAYYIDHENERKEIAHNGYMRLKENYTYEIQMEKLLTSAFKE